MKKLLALLLSACMLLTPLTLFASDEISASSETASFADETTISVIVTLGENIQSVTLESSGLSIIVSKPTTAPSFFSKIVHLEIGTTFTVKAIASYGYTSSVTPAYGIVGTTLTSVVATATYNPEKSPYSAVDFIIAVNLISTNPDVDDRYAVDYAAALYAAISPEEKKQSDVLAAKAKLDSAEVAVKAAEEKRKSDQVEADKAADAIKKIPTTVDIIDENAIKHARNLYDSLNADQKKLVSSELFKKLESAEKALATAKADQAAADRVTQVIDALPSVITESDKTVVERARDAYENLRASQRKRLTDTTLKKLTDAEKVLIDIAEEKYKIDLEAVDTFKTAVKAIPGCPAGEGKALLEAATDIYEGLTSTQKDLISEKILKSYKDSLQAFRSGRKFEAGGSWYKVMENGDVTFLYPSNKKIKTFTLSNKVKNGKNFFKVSAVSNLAFDGCVNLQWIVLRENIEKIGRLAFRGTKNLKKITLRTKRLLEGSVISAFSQTRSDLVVKVPADKLKDYTNLFKNEGQLKGTTKSI